MLLVCSTPFKSSSNSDGIQSRTRSFQGALHVHNFYALLIFHCSSIFVTKVKNIIYYAGILYAIRENIAFYDNSAN